MILKALRWFGRLDRSYFFAISALISAVVVSVFLGFAPAVEATDGRSVSLIEDGGAIVIPLLILPLLILATPLVSLPRHTAPIDLSHKINSLASSFLFLVIAFLLGPTALVAYVPPLIFSIASTISLYFGRNRKPVEQVSKGRPTDEHGIRLSRAGVRRLREQERLAAAGEETEEKQEESPLVSSRRRRGRNRRKR